MTNTKISLDSIGPNFSDPALTNLDLANTELADNQLKILHLIKKRGDMTASYVAQQIKMTSMGARQHLEILETQGYIQHLFKKAGRGRPKKYWQMATKGQSLFPDGHAHLIANLLGHMKDHLGEEVVDQLIICREKDMLQNYQAALNAISDLEAKLEQLAKMRTNEGYMAYIEKKHDSWLLIEDHCPIGSAASQCQQFCRSEQMIFETVLQTKVERTEYILKGDRRCCYKISVQKNL